MAVATRTEAGHAITRRGQVIEFGFWGVWGPAEREAWERDLTRHLDQVAPGFQLLVTCRPTRRRTRPPRHCTTGAWASVCSEASARRCTWCRAR